jgi:hypothetical protein
MRVELNDNDCKSMNQTRHLPTTPRLPGGARFSADIASVAALEKIVGNKSNQNQTDNQ